MLYNNQNYFDGNDGNQKVFYEFGKRGRIGEQLKKGISGKTGMVHQHQITKLSERRKHYE